MISGSSQGMDAGWTRKRVRRRFVFKTEQNRGIYSELLLEDMIHNPGVGGRQLWVLVIGTLAPTIH